MGTDAAVAVTSPATIPLSAVYDSLDWDDHTPSAATIVMFPLALPLNAIKHTAYTLVHGADLLLSPFYLLASITPENDLAPIELYSLEHGYPWKSKDVPYLQD